MKIGDLVRLKKEGKIGLVTKISSATPLFPYELLTVVFEDFVLDGILPRIVEVISETSES